MLVVIIMLILLSLFSTSYTGNRDREIDAIKDNINTDIIHFFHSANRTYYITRDYITKDTLVLPPNITICFEGGRISAPIKFNETRLDGDVKLQGSELFGNLTNEFVYTSWICNMDAQTDDAENIRKLLRVSNCIKFSSGKYLLKTPKMECSNKSIEAFIPIDRSNITLEGENEVQLITDTPINLVCIFSKPNDIENSINNILIRNLTFVVNNNTKEFHEYAHVIKTIGVHNLRIQDCKFKGFFGDAICLSHYGDTPVTGERTRNSNVYIVNNIINGLDNNNRNGISVINGFNVKIINNEIRNTTKNGMPGAIDVEANNEAYTLDRIEICNNKIYNSNGGGICVISQNNAPAHNISIVENKIENCIFGMVFYVCSDDCVSDVSIINNNVINNQSSVKYIGNGTTSNWTVINNDKMEIPINFK